MTSLLIEKRRLKRADLPVVRKPVYLPALESSTIATPERLLKKVCQYYGIYLSDVKSKSRKPELVRTRLVFSYIGRSMGFPLTSIGAAVNRDHSNVHYQCNKVKELIDINKPWHDPRLVDDIANINNLLKSNCIL